MLQTFLLRFIRYHECIYSTDTRVCGAVHMPLEGRIGREDHMQIVRVSNLGCKSEYGYLELWRRKKRERDVNTFKAIDIGLAE